MSETHPKPASDDDFDRPTRDKSLGRDAHGRPMITIPRNLLVNQAPPRRDGSKAAGQNGEAAEQRLLEEEWERLRSQPGYRPGMKQMTATHTVEEMAAAANREGEAREPGSRPRRRG